jgi:TonB-dependent starch-binding outer membrane protein SusC
MFSTYFRLFIECVINLSKKSKMMKVRQILVLIAFMLASTAVAFAQKTVKGTVTDADNKDPLVGASIVVKGTSKGALADVNGAFSLEVPSNATTLVVSFVGYNSK